MYGSENVEYQENGIFEIWQFRTVKFEVKPQIRTCEIPEELHFHLVMGLKFVVPCLSFFPVIKMTAVRASGEYVLHLLRFKDNM